MKKIFLFWFVFLTIIASADEGMWVLSLINKKYEDIKKQGLKLTPDDIYNINHASLKDAIVGLSNVDSPLGFFCSASLVSSKGLVFTNHHCGFDAIQQHSTLEHNYLVDGFWAKDFKDELPNEDLCASILVKIEDVTIDVLDGIDAKMPLNERLAKIEEKIRTIESEFAEDTENNYQIVDMFGGNQYLLFVYKTFYDVRLVGAPPSAIGKFGGDTDNWMWTRHTGDFSIFRIYTSPDGKPAKYSPLNVPYQPIKNLNVSIKGIKQGDFAMTIGFPGTTNRYMTSYAVQNEIDIVAPSVIKIRAKKLDIIEKGMKKSAKTKIQYASKYSECSNYYKYYIGEREQLIRNKVIDKKKAIEDKFNQWLMQNPTKKEEYDSVLLVIKNYYQEYKESIKAYQYLNEAIFGGCELVYFPFKILGLYELLQYQMPMDSIKPYIEEIKKQSDNFYKNFDAEIDKELFVNLFTMYAQDIQPTFHLNVMNLVEKKYKGNFSVYADKIYAKSIFSDQQRFNKFLEKPDIKILNNDPFFIIAQDAFYTYWFMNINEDSLHEAERLWIKAQMEMHPDSIFYPDANSTIRLSYGNVKDYIPRDAVHYDYYTTIDGIMEKEDVKNEEFNVPTRLKELYKNKDYGQYVNEHGTVPVCFITTNDITGGNSGSCVLDADGNLIGIAFDGNWEAMSGDINYEPNLQRTICVDARYVLFIIDKYSGATRLVNEIKLIK
ncbi:MAG: S46 family peptidase [Bacteroidales bacterium]|nr:S46 family peptidase [Bacteroidales bacterium]